MTPNDKLPEEIQTQVCNASAQYLKKLIADKRDPCCYAVTDYIAGATAWAPWKVKYNELHSELHETKKQADNLRNAYDELGRKAQRMADALEGIKTYGPIDEQTVKFIDKALSGFKDGGKEVEPVKEIEYMPIHPDDARKFDCPTQFPMHLLSEGRAQSNHGQTLKRLKERGGLSVREILAIVGNKGWNYYGGLQWTEAIKMLNDIIISNPTK